MKYLCAFSSDARDLYKADIYRVLSFPRNSIVHFRYKPKYVDDNIYTNIKSNINKEVVIFFTHGNKDNTSNTVGGNISIRKAILVNCEISKETELFHAYLQLTDFCNVTIDSHNPNEKKPAIKFFSELECTIQIDKHGWINRIEEIKDHFQEFMFYNIKSISTSLCKKEITIYNDNKSFCYKLTHGKRYILNVALANPKITNCKLNIESSSDDITINTINPFQTTIQYDDIALPVYIKTLTSFNESTLIAFSPIVDDKIQSEYSSNIELNLHLSLIRPFLFGLFSLGLLWGVLLSQPVSQNAVKPCLFQLIISSLFVFISSGFLFYWFNKK